MDAERFDAQAEIDSAIATEENRVDTDTSTEPAKPSEAGKEVSQGQTGKEATPYDFEKDEEFKKTVPQNFQNDKRWRQIYRNWKDTERKSQEFEKKLQELADSPKDEPMEITAENLQSVAEQFGYQLTPRQAQAAVSSPEKADDLMEMISKTATPEDREWLTKYTTLLEKRISDKFAKDLSPILNPVSEMIVDRRLEQSEKNARKYVDDINKKYSMNIDYDKDVDPELVKILQGNKNLNLTNTDVLGLTKEFFAQKGIEFGKKMSEESMRKLNEEKKKAGMETDGVSSSTESEYLGIKDHLKNEMRKENVSYWG